MPKFLIDENLPRSSAKLFQQMGHDALHVKGAGLEGALDDEIFAYAQAQQRIIVTRDLGLGNLLDYPLGTHCGIVVVRVPSHYIASQINAVLTAFLKEVDVERVREALTIVEPGRYRIRQSRASEGKLR